MRINPRHYNLVKELIGLIVLIDGPLGFYVGWKAAEGEWIAACVGLVLSALLAWVYWKLYAWWMERISRHAKD